MLWTPPAAPWGSESPFHDAASVAVSPGTQLTNPTSTNTKSAWVNVSPALVGNVCEIELVAIGTGATGANTCALLDIGVGAAGSEIVLIADLPIGFCSTQGSGIPGTIRLPVAIPAGTRVSIRNQSQRSGFNFNVAVMFNYGVAQSGVAFTATQFDTYGIRTASSNGQEVTPNATASTNGSWVELTSGTARDHRGFLLLSQGWGGTAAGSISMNAVGYILELGAGASGSEVVIGSVHIRTSTAEVRQGPWPSWPIWRPLPAGTRLAARCRCSGSSGLSIDAVAIGIS